MEVFFTLINCIYAKNYILRTFLVSILALSTSLIVPGAADATRGPVTAPSPTGVRLMHRDMNSSDTMPWAGPGNNPSVTFSVPFGACSTAFQTSQKMTIALCTKYLGFRHGVTPIAPTVVLMDPQTAQPTRHVGTP